MADDDMQRILDKYRARLNREINTEIDPATASSQEQIESVEYQQFRKDRLGPSLTFYEKACQLSEKYLKIKPDQKEYPKLDEAIRIAHLNTTPSGATSFALLGPLLFIFLGVMLTIIVPTLLGKDYSMFFIVIIMTIGVSLIFILRKLPEFLANSYRLKASNEMVLSIFYVVTYMRHTSNLELAVKFASDHLNGPLSLDLKKVVWDVETQKFPNIKESLDHYLETWRKWNMEFIESFHLIESSLYESSESRRIQLLEKGLDVILEETYEKMLHYAHNLKSPITMLHMLGIILPILGLVILPLVVSFMKGVTWYMIAGIYNIIIPILVYYLGKSILSKRPTGYGQLDIADYSEEMKKYRYIIIKLGNVEFKITPLVLSFTVGGIFLFLALLPILLHLFGFADVGIGNEDPTTQCGKAFCLLDYKPIEGTDKFIGPFGIFSGVLSLFFPLAIAFAVGIYYKHRTEKLMVIRNNTKELEKEFASGLFQLGNRLGDEIPAETAFGKVAQVMEGTKTARFFQTVSMNITKMGLGVNEAIFNPKVGAIRQYPSRMIVSSMKVLSQSIRKGPRIAAQALINIARYIKEMHRVEERLKDLLSDVISSMKSQISVMTPAIAGIVIGITSMISNILGKLGPLMSSYESDGATAGVGGLQEDLFGLGIPTYFFQAIVGIYVVQIIYILTILTNGIENGSDKLNEQYSIGKNLLRSTTMYVLIAGVIMIVFNFIANTVLQNVLQ